MILCSLIAIRLLHCRFTFWWLVMRRTRVMSNTTRIYFVWMSARSYRIFSDYNASNKRNQAAGMKVKMLANVSIITKLFVALAMIKLVRNLALVLAAQCKKRSPRRPQCV